jgi:N-acetylneuraminic acid mutarotase
MLAVLALTLLIVDPPTMVSGHAGAMVDGKIYFVGGMGLPRRDAFFSTLWEVDPVSGRWTQHSDIKLARGMAGGAYLNGSIYIAGGMTWDGTTLTSVERYDLHAGKWQAGAPLHESRNRLSMVALNGKLYAICGIRGQRTSDDHLNTPSIEEYYPEKNAWREAGALNHARHGFAAVAWQNRIYVFGGNDGESEKSAECWNPATGKSIDLPDMPVPRGFGGAVVSDGRIICFGGRQPLGRSHPSAFDPTRKRGRNCLPRTPT